MLPGDIQTQQRSVHPAGVFKFISAGTGGKILIKPTIAAEEADMLPGSKVEHADKIERSLRADTETTGVRS